MGKLWSTWAKPFANLENFTSQLYIDLKDCEYFKTFILYITVFSIILDPASVLIRKLFISISSKTYPKAYSEELKAGNTLLELPCCTNWPQEGSIFASLANRLTVGKKVLTDDVYYSINDDVHYGWIDECVCKIHHDLLVAGNLMTNKHKWFVFK